MVSPIDPRFLGDPSDWLAFQQLQSGTPDIFRVFLNTFAGSVVFRVGTTNIGRGRRQVSSYNIRFLPMSLANPGTLFSLEGQTAAWEISDIILSTGAPGPGGIAEVSSVSQYGKAGFYFASPVNQAGQESRFFAGPVQAPLPGSLTTNATPPDVSNQTVAVATETKNGYSVRKLTFSATVPSNAMGVVAVIIQNMGSGGTPGAAVPVTFTPISGVGSGAEATAKINSVGGVGEIIMSETGNGYLVPPTVTVAGVSASLEAVLGYGTDFAGYQIYMDGYFGAFGAMEAQYISGANIIYPGSTLIGSFYLMPDTSSSPPPDIDFYFVSISSTGARRSDPSSAPVYTLVGGLA